jgi:hypothetical protein
MVRARRDRVRVSISGVGESSAQRTGGTGRGGNPDLVFLVVEALALAQTLPETVREVEIPCDGLACVKQWWRQRGR